MTKSRRSTSWRTHLNFYVRYIRFPSLIFLPNPTEFHIDYRDYSMASNSQSPSTLFQRRATNNPSLHDADGISLSSCSHSSDLNSSPHDGTDLEKAETVECATNGTSSGAYREASGGRVSRIQSLQRKRTTFDHPLSHIQTNADVIVDFDGPDDPYRPINWPFRKKVITTALYGFTTMGSTWASSV